jgi:ABC-type uncharacterized transport system substrate-binding protein
MERRAFIGSLAGSLLAAPLAAEAEQAAGKVWRIGVLGFSLSTADMIGPTPTNAYPAALLTGLRQLGYVYGQHFVTEARGAGGVRDRYPALVDELIRLRVDVIVAVAASMAAVKAATSTIPVVFPGYSDPVGHGYAKSLSHPGGNFTGLSFQGPELAGKRLELLKELAQTPAPVAVLWEQPFPREWKMIEAAGRARGWKLLSFPVRNIDEIEPALKLATKAKAGALLLTGGEPFDPNPRRVAELAAQYRLPAMYHFRYYVEAGGLACYAADLLEIWRAAAVFVDKILKGAKPADLPIEQPTKIDLLINLKTAKALGLTIPPSLLQRADQIIE